MLLFLKKNEIVVLGQYYKPNAKIAKDQSLGLYVDIFNTKGEITYSQKISWAEDIHRFLPIKKGSKLKDIGYIFFHDIIRTQNGDFYAIGEQFKKTVSAACNNCNNWWFIRWRYSNVGFDTTYY